jgi:nucleotide-binding universal stress UspA family protein
MKPIRKILVPTDFSDHSKEALAWAIDLARRFDARLTVAHAYQPVAMALPDGYVMQSAPSLATMLSDLEDALAKIKREAEAGGANVPIDTQLLQGPAFAEIVRFAREGSFDLIVIATHGRTGLKHALLGSVAEKVVRKAPCPVLTVRPAGHTFEHP